MRGDEVGNVIGFVIGLTAGGMMGALVMALMVAAGDYDRREEDRYLEGWESGVRYGKRFHEEITKGGTGGQSMSILIKGMNMPNDCCQCKLARYDDYENETFCPFTDVMCLSIGRQDNCPLEEVPETHEKRTETHACDCISRKEAIDAHYEYCNKHPDAGFPVWSLKILEDLPSAQPEPNWIPCSERLPKKPDGYPKCEIRRTYFLVTLESGCVKTLAYEFDRDEWQITGSPVIAWMPLPEPYAERRTDERTG